MNLNTHPVPEYAQKLLLEHGGLAPNGQQMFRFIWGEDRLSVMGGKWKKFDEHGNEIGSVIEEKLTYKYLGCERWVLEVWCPAENYGTPEQWEQQNTVMIDGITVHTLGPYPINGEYEPLKILETPNKKDKAGRGYFVPLTATVAEAAASVAVMNRHLPKAIRMEAYREAQKRSEEAKSQKRVDIINDLGLAWEGKPYSVMPANLTQKGRVSLT